MISISLISVTTRITFLLTKHPLSIGFTLIIQTITVAIITGIIVNIFWFSYILIISILRGILVLFIYIARVASNEKFYTSWSMAIYIIPLTISSVILFFIVDQLENERMWSTIKKNTLGAEQLIRLNKLFNLNNISITIMLVSYLFLTIIAITYVTNIYEGPLRIKN